MKMKQTLKYNKYDHAENYEHKNKSYANYVKDKIINMKKQ